MKKKLLALFTGLLAITAVNAQTPVNFNCNDCAGANHDLFSELASGKVIVISWVMPCSSCLGPTLTASNIVQSYASSNPGQVLMYVSDDYANTNCTSLNSWVNGNGITATTFSNSLVDMGDYGSAGMPKIIVLGGGSTPTVFFNQNNSAAGNSTAIQNAINSALLTGVNESSAAFGVVNLFPNPSTDLAAITFNAQNSGEGQIEVYNQLGQEAMDIFSGTFVQGENKVQFSVAGLASGIYFVKISDAENSRMIKIIVSH
ncbi:MAG TPA: T9SS type A sorting domain-containing protein [Bacteroidia bacterium]|nr:T9SS type A sorting domain-containing protein [Bacteroidia bacterium]